MQNPIFEFDILWRGVCWFSLGLPFALVGIAIRTGRINRWYLHTQPVPYMPPSSMYSLFPLSFAFFIPPIILPLPMSVEIREGIVFSAWAVCFVLMFVFPIWQPNFLKPKWLRKLEAEYPPDVIEYFRIEWSKLDRDEWARKIGTEDGMEELIRLVTD